MISYRKIPKGAYIQRGVIFGRAYYRREICVSKSAGLMIRGNNLGGLSSEGRIYGAEGLIFRMLR